MAPKSLSPQIATSKMLQKIWASFGYVPLQTSGTHMKLTIGNLRHLIREALSLDESDAAEQSADVQNYIKTVNGQYESAWANSKLDIYALQKHITDKLNFVPAKKGDYDDAVRDGKSIMDTAIYVPDDDHPLRAHLTNDAEIIAYPRYQDGSRSGKFGYYVLKTVPKKSNNNGADNFRAAFDKER